MKWFKNYESDIFGAFFLFFYAVFVVLIWWNPYDWLGGILKIILTIVAFVPAAYIAHGLVSLARWFLVNIVGKAWERSTPWRRIKAVHALNDPSVLATIVVKGTYSDAKTAALARLDDQDHLASLAEALDNKKLLKTAMDKINDPDRLRRIQEHGRSSFARMQAAIKLRNVDYLQRVALGTDEELSLEAVEYLSNPKQLARVAQQSNVSDIRVAATQRIDDQGILADMVRRANYRDTMLAAVGRIRVTEELSRIAREAVDDPEVRATAARTMGDTELEKSIRAEWAADQHRRFEAAIASKDQFAFAIPSENLVVIGKIQGLWIDTASSASVEKWGGFPISNRPENLTLFTVFLLTKAKPLLDHCSRTNAWNWKLIDDLYKCFSRPKSAEDFRNTFADLVAKVPGLEGLEGLDRGIAELLEQPENSAKWPPAGSMFMTSEELPNGTSKCPKCRTVIVSAVNRIAFPRISPEDRASMDLMRKDLNRRFFHVKCPICSTTYILNEDDSDG